MTVRNQDRRAVRHRETRDEIVQAAWGLSRDHGLTGWSLAELGRAVGMRAPSLYTYFGSKDAIYDAMFAQGNRDLLRAARVAFTSIHDDTPPREILRLGARSFTDFAMADPVRYQLLFQRVIPGFVPSEESYAHAVGAFRLTADALARAGVHGDEAVDLWTAVVSGLTAQQLANDPDGDRWTRLVDDAVDMFFTHATESKGAR